jgi:hypothetical protein
LTTRNGIHLLYLCSYSPLDHYRRTTLYGVTKWKNATDIPPDDLADIRAELQRLEEQEQTLRAFLLEHPEDRIGDENVASIGEQQRKRIDLKALADEIGLSVLQRFTAYRTCPVVRLRECDRA